MLTRGMAKVTVVSSKPKAQPAFQALLWVSLRAPATEAGLEQPAGGQGATWSTGMQFRLSLDKAACYPPDTEYAVLDMQLWASHQETTEIS